MNKDFKFRVVNSDAKKNFVNVVVGAIGTDRNPKDLSDLLDHMCKNNYNFNTYGGKDNSVVYEENCIFKVRMTMTFFSFERFELMFPEFKRKKLNEVVEKRYEKLEKIFKDNNFSKDEENKILRAYTENKSRLSKNHKIKYRTDSSCENYVFYIYDSVSTIEICQIPITDYNE